MTKPPTQVWKMTVAKVGDGCTITCDGAPVYASAAVLHAEVGQPTTLHLTFPVYLCEPYRTYHRDDELIVEGTPMFTTIAIGDRCYRLVEIREGDRDDGLFGADEGLERPSIPPEPEFIDLAEAETPASVVVSR